MNEHRERRPIIRCDVPEIPNLFKGVRVRSIFLTFLHVVLTEEVKHTL